MEKTMTFDEVLPIKKHMTKILTGMPPEIKEKVEFIHVPENTTLLKRGEEINNIYMILSGVVRVGNWSVDRLIFALSTIQDDEIVGEMEVLAGVNTAYFNIITGTNCFLCKLAKEEFFYWLERDAYFAKWLAEVNAKRHCNNTYLFDEYTYLDVNHKFQLLLYRSLYEEVKKKGNALLEMTRQELAELMGTSLRSINRVIKQLKDEGAIDIIKGKIYLETIHIEYIRNVLLKINLPKQLLIPFTESFLSYL